MVIVRGARAWSWLLCLPMLAALAALTFYPLGRTFLHSLTNAKLTSLDHPDWIGFENYAYLFRDPDWWKAARNTALFAVVSVSIEAVLGMGIALLLDAKFRARGLLRAAVLVPWAIPAVVSARIWAWMFNDVYGVVNETLRRAGIGDAGIAWIADDRWSRMLLIVVDVWKTTPFMALMLLAGLQSIPSSVREAAKVDGATGLRELRDVTLPLVMPALRVAVLFRLLDALRIFDLPFVLTSNSKETAVVSIYARQQMLDFQDVGYGSAASFAIFCATAAIALAYLASARRSLGLER